MRPINGHEAEGEDAYYQGTMTSAWPKGSVAAAAWQIGWTKGACDAGMLDHEDDTIHRARADMSFLISHLRAELPSLSSVEQAVGEASSAWPLRCHEIAAKIAASAVLAGVEDGHGRLHVAYGIYQGPVATSSPFASRPISRHGWLETASGLVIDATRWVFTGRPPSLWVGSTRDYDLGGVALRDRVRPSAPVPGPGDLVLDITALSDTTRRGLGDLLGDSSLSCRGEISLKSAFWLAGEPPQRLGREVAREFYDLLVARQLSALVPVDFRTILAMADDLQDQQITRPTPGRRD